MPSPTSAATSETRSEDHGYVVREPWRSLYSGRFETMLVRVTSEDGTTGWGEALAPVGARRCRPRSSTGCSPAG
ncbi:hypothetical protein [Amycolatopsis methanolica]|uniref:hypothetical protein n=1 Tax=Amycolatopsis methanolica TaxID=1814 RepID=UPI00341F078D